MTHQSSADTKILEDKLERIAALQQAIEQASREVQTTQLLAPQEQQLMLRIMAQRRRWHQRAAQPEIERERRASARARESARSRVFSSTAEGTSAHAWSDGAGMPRALVGDVSSLLQSMPLVADAQALAMRRPVAVGLALGASLVIIGPKRLMRCLVWWTPFVWRSVRVAQRVNTSLRKR